MRGSVPDAPNGSPSPPRIDDVTWLEPYPEQLLEALPEDPLGPHARIGAREAMGVGFVVALQRLTPRQRAMVTLCDVAGFSTAEAASMLGTADATLTRALERARARIDAERLPREAPPAPESPVERSLVRAFIDAWMIRARARPGEVRLLATRANGQPALGHYRRERPTAPFRLTELLVLELAGDRITAIRRLGAANLPPQLGLPDSLDG